MKFTRRRMLDSFKQLETELEGNLDNMKLYHNMSDKELSELHKEWFDGMYEKGYNYGYEYDTDGKIIDFRELLDELYQLTIAEQERVLNEKESERYYSLYETLNKHDIAIGFGVII